MLYQGTWSSVASDRAVLFWEQLARQRLTLAAQLSTPE